MMLRPRARRQNETPTNAECVCRGLESAGYTLQATAFSHWRQVDDETQLKGPGTGAGASRKNVRVVPWGDEQGVVDGVAP